MTTPTKLLPAALLGAAFALLAAPAAQAHDAVNRYPAPVDARTFDATAGGWDVRGEAPGTTGLSLSSARADDAGDGLLRVRITGAASRAGSGSVTWTSPAFDYRGSGDHAPKAQTLVLRQRTTGQLGRLFADQPLTVSVVPVGGGAPVATAQVAGPGDGWADRRTEIDAAALKLGGSYRLRFTLAATTTARERVDGAIESDCVALVAASAAVPGDACASAGGAAVLTGTEAAAATGTATEATTTGGTTTGAVSGGATAGADGTTTGGTATAADGHGDHGDHGGTQTTATEPDSGSGSGEHEGHMGQSGLANSGTGMVYVDDVDGRTFDRYEGMWTQSRDRSACVLLAICAVADGNWAFDGTNGLIRVQLNGSSLPGGTVSHFWTSPAFTYRGHDGDLPDKNVVQYRLRANVKRFQPGELENGRYIVQILDQDKKVVAQNGGRELTPAATWKAASYEVPATALRLGGTYRLRIVTEFAKKGGSQTSGTVDWDCVALVAKGPGMTGSEGCGPKDEPPNPGEWVMGGGTSPVCSSPLSFLVGPLDATLKQLLTGPNGLAAGVGATTADLVNALLDPAKPLSVALGQVLAAFASTTGGLTGPLASLAGPLRGVSEPLFGALSPATGLLNWVLSPVAQLVSTATGAIVGPVAQLAGTLLSPLGYLTAPLMPIYDSLVRPIVQPLLSAILDPIRQNLGVVLGPNGLKVLRDIMDPLSTAATGLVGPVSAAIGTLHPIHATIVGLLDPIYQSTIGALGPDAGKFTSFLSKAYVHSFPGCGDLTAHQH